MTLLGGAAAWPLAARAQQPERIRRIGVLMGYAEGDREGLVFVTAFRQGLQKLGWIEGRNVQIDARWGAGREEPTQQLAKDLVRLKPDLILSHSTVTTAALLKLTRTIPVVFANVTDPIGSGFVVSLPQPGGNATGFVNMEDSMSGKWLELLKEVAPRVRRVAFLFNPRTAPYFQYYLTTLQAAAPSFAVEAIAAPVNDGSELEPLMAAHAREADGGMIVMTDNFTTSHRWRSPHWLLAIVSPLSIRIVSSWILAACCHTAATSRIIFGAPQSYVDRIFKGTNPNELPVQAPVRFELVINLKTARALGLEVSSQLQQRADEVIE